MSRLEQLNSYLKEFTSTITAIKEDKAHTVIALAESVFYPTSGGQSFDTGSINGHSVLDVFKEEKRDDTVWHKLEKAHFQIGERVHGIIDWERRYKHMQRHTAEHMLAQAFVRVNPVFETQAVNLGNVVSTLDIGGQPSEQDVNKAEAIVNSTAYQNLPVTAFEIDESEINHYPLRRAPKVSGKIRIVNIGDFDYSACGGTHLRSSAEALPIKVVGFEKIKGNLTRIYFMAGQEAFSDYTTKHTISTQLAKSFSSGVEQLPDRIAQLRDELKHTKRQLLGLQDMVATSIAETLLQQAQTTAKGKVVTHVLDESQSMLLQPLSKILGAQPDVVAFLGSVSDKASLLFVRGKDVDVAVNSILSEVLYLIQGKGGGNAERAQGHGSDAAGVTQAVEYARILFAGQQ
jgi:alanyl-tRNA synthetase